MKLPDIVEFLEMALQAVDTKTKVNIDNNGSIVAIHWTYRTSHCCSQLLCHKEISPVAQKQEDLLSPPYKCRKKIRTICIARKQWHEF
jgi:hypothetical protein